MADVPYLSPAWAHLLAVAANLRQARFEAKGTPLEAELGDILQETEEPMRHLMRVIQAIRDELPHGNVTPERKLRE